MFMAYMNIQDTTGNVLANFIKLALAGQFKSKPVFLGLVEAMTVQADKEARGVGMQNMKYPPILEDFCHLASIVAPRAYRIFRSHFTGRTPRSIQ